MALTSANVRLSSDFVKAQLLQDNKHVDNSSSSDTALYSKSNKVYNKRKSVVCFKCNKEDHFKSCPNYKKDLKTTKNVKNKLVNTDKKDKALLVANSKDSTSED